MPSMPLNCCLYLSRVLRSKGIHYNREPICYKFDLILEGSLRSCMAVTLGRVRGNGAHQGGSRLSQVGPQKADRKGADQCLASLSFPFGLGDHNGHQGRTVGSDPKPTWILNSVLEILSQ